MLRAFDLSAMEDEVNQHLNDPELRLISLDIYCSEETAYTVANLRLAACEKREFRFYRYLKRYILLGGIGHPEVDKTLNNPDVRLIKYYMFPTAEGTVVVLDYQVRKERVDNI